MWKKKFDKVLSLTHLDISNANWLSILLLNRAHVHYSATKVVLLNQTSDQHRQHPHSTLASKTLRDWPVSTPLFSSHTCHSTCVCFLFLEQARFAHASGPLRVLVPLPRMFFLQLSPRLAPPRQLGTSSNAPS